MAPIATAVFSLRHRPKAASQFQIGATHRPPHVKNAKAASLLLLRRRLLKKIPLRRLGDSLSLISRSSDKIVPFFSRWCFLVRYFCRRFTKLGLKGEREREEKVKCLFREENYVSLVVERSFTTDSRLVPRTKGRKGGDLCAEASFGR